MKTCPYCQSELAWKTVKYRWSDSKKWYQFSNEPYVVSHCGVCDNQLVKEFNQRWYYQLASSLFLLTIVLAIIFSAEMSAERKQGK